MVEGINYLQHLCLPFDSSAVTGFNTSGHWFCNFHFQGSCPACKRRFVGYRNQVIRCMNCQNIVWQPNSGSSGGAGRSRSSGPDVIDVEFEEKWWTCCSSTLHGLIRERKMRRLCSGLDLVSRFVYAAFSIRCVVSMCNSSGLCITQYIIVCAVVSSCTVICRACERHFQ